MTYLAVHLAVHTESSSAYELHTSAVQCLEVPTGYKMKLFLDHWKKFGGTVDTVHGITSDSERS